MLATTGRLTEAEGQYRQALELQQHIVDEVKDVPLHRRNLAVTLGNLGNLLRQMDRGREALDQYSRALSILQKLAADFKTIPDYSQLLSNCHNSLGNLLINSNLSTQSEANFRQAITIENKLIHDFGRLPQYSRDLATSYNGLGLALEKLNRWSEAEEPLREGMAIREKLVADFPGVPGYRIDLGGSYCNLGGQFSGIGRPSESLVWFDKAIQMLKPVYEHDRRQAAAKQYLLNSYAARAKACDHLEKYSESVKDWDNVIELMPKQEQAKYRVGRAYAAARGGKVAEAVAEVAELTKAGNWLPEQRYYFAGIYAIASAKIADKKQEYADRAMELLRQAVAGGYKDLALIKKDADLNSLRDRADFKQIIADLEKKSTPPNPASTRTEKDKP